MPPPLNSITLSYKDIITLLRVGLDSVPVAADLARHVYGDAAPMCFATFSLTNDGEPKVSVSVIP